MAEASRELVEAAFSAGFKHCRSQVEDILAAAETWPMPYGFTFPQKRRFLLAKIRSAIEKLKAIDAVPASSTKP